MELDGHVCPECMPVVQLLLGEIESLRAWIARREGIKDEGDTGRAGADGGSRC
jgi:hypothetical protein